MSLKDVLGRLSRWSDIFYEDQSSLDRETTWLNDLVKRLAVSSKNRESFYSGQEAELSDEDAELIASFWTLASSSSSDAGIINFSVLLTKILRNSIADNAHGQRTLYPLSAKAFVALRCLASLNVTQQNNKALLTRTLVQFLSNLVTENASMQEQFWRDHIQDQASNDDQSSDAAILCRLIQSADAGTKSSALVLLLNLTSSGQDRLKCMCTTSYGADVVISILHAMESDVEAEIVDEEAEEAEVATFESDSALKMVLQPSVQAIRRSRERTEGMGLAYAFLQKVFECGLFDQLYDSLASSSAMSALKGSDLDLILVTKPQLSLLKVLDAYLQQSRSEKGSEETNTATIDVQHTAFTSLPLIFRHLADSATGIMRDLVEQRESTEESAMDVRLLETHVALILLLQCLISFILIAESGKETDRLVVNAETILSSLRSTAFMGCLIEFIRVTARFSPSVSPFKGSNANVPKYTSAPQGHSLSSTGKANLQDEARRMPKLDGLKRDMISLLGALTFVRKGKDDGDEIRRVQDQVREQGGLLDILNLTQLDENNPYIRERAIFALRNLLSGNQASQDFIGQLKPVDSDSCPS